MASFTTPIKPKEVFSLGGVKRVWLADKKYVQDYTYQDDEFGIIELILTSSGVPSSFYEFHCDGEYVGSEETLNISQADRAFPQKINLRFAAMDHFKRAILETMIYTRLACVYEDNNGKMWLLGQEFGMKVTEYQGRTDVRFGGNSYTCTLIGNERMQQREVNKENFIYTFPNGSGSSIPTGFRYPEPPENPKITGLGGSGPGGGITQDLSTWGIYESGVMVTPMPLSQLGNIPLIKIMQ